MHHIGQGENGAISSYMCSIRSYCVSFSIYWLAAYLLIVMCVLECQNYELTVNDLFLFSVGGGKTKPN